MDQVLPGYRFPGLFSLLTWKPSVAFQRHEKKCQADEKNLFVYCTTVVCDQGVVFVKETCPEGIPDFFTDFIWSEDTLPSAALLSFLGGVQLETERSVYSPTPKQQKKRKCTPYKTDHRKLNILMDY